MRTMKSSGCAPGEGGDAGFGAGAYVHGRFRLGLLGIAGIANVDALRRGADGHRHALDDRMVISPGDVEAL